MVSNILAIYGIGLPAFVLIKAFIPGFFAREDTRTPMIFAAISVVVNVSLAITLFQRMGPSGIAIAEITAGWVNAALLFATLVKRGHWGNDIPLLTRIPRLLIAAGVMAIGIHFAIGYFASRAFIGIVFWRACWNRHGHGCGSNGRLFRAGLWAWWCKYRHDPPQHQAWRCEERA